jgi:hypothetical protein
MNLHRTPLNLDKKKTTKMNTKIPPNLISKDGYQIVSINSNSMQFTSKQVL